MQWFQNCVSGSGGDMRGGKGGSWGTIKNVLSLSIYYPADKTKQWLVCMQVFWIMQKNKKYFTYLKTQNKMYLNIYNILYRNCIRSLRGSLAEVVCAVDREAGIPEGCRFESSRGTVVVPLSKALLWVSGFTNAWRDRAVRLINSTYWATAYSEPFRDIDVYCR